MSCPPVFRSAQPRVLAGTPTSSGTFNFTVTSTDAGTPTIGNRTYSLTVAAPTLALPSATLAVGTAGQAYSAAIAAASGGIAPYAYTVTAGALPAGLSLNVRQARSAAHPR